MSRYKALGVDVKKEGIHVFKGVVNNLYPGAFCVITRDPENPERGLVAHTDSAGSKPIISYLGYKESGDPSWFKGLAQDAVAMNIDDTICVGAEAISFIDYIAYNPILIERVEMLAALSQGFEGTFKKLEEIGLPVLFGGGETADLPDQMKTLDVCGALFARVDLEKAVTGYQISPGDVIVGLRSGGKVSYENEVNSGIMCNGHTLARNCLMSGEYLEKYPELAHPDRARFTGSYSIDDNPVGLGMTVGEALTSPTRIFAPIAAKVLESVGDSVHGMVHNTGGGQTKCLSLGNGVDYIKNTLPEPDPIFHLIQGEGHVEWREMYEDFNMGIGFEFIVEPGVAEEVIRIAENFGIGVQVIGRCEKSEEGNTLKITCKSDEFRYARD
jgi:phosphoribosylformylglycinamidine cyclo-ligase|tara:strand:- start:3244 stop:4398 length:1155 start_codon:yes stop_codon:yes gene_type:complete